MSKTRTSTMEQVLDHVLEVARYFFRGQGIGHKKVSLSIVWVDGISLLQEILCFTFLALFEFNQSKTPEAICIARFTGEGSTKCFLRFNAVIDLIKEVA